MFINAARHHLIGTFSSLDLCFIHSMGMLNNEEGSPRGRRVPLPQPSRNITS